MAPVWMTVQRAQANSSPTDGPKARDEKMVLATGMRMSAAKLGVAKRTHQRDQPARDPQAEKHRVSGHVAGDNRRRLEDADADDDTDQHGGAFQNGHVLLRLCGWRGLQHRIKSLRGIMVCELPVRVS